MLKYHIHSSSFCSALHTYFLYVKTRLYFVVWGGVRCRGCLWYLRSLSRYVLYTLCILGSVPWNHNTYVCTWYTYLKFSENTLHPIPITLTILNLKTWNINIYLPTGQISVSSATGIVIKGLGKHINKLTTNTICWRSSSLKEWG